MIPRDTPLCAIAGQCPRCRGNVFQLLLPYSAGTEQGRKWYVADGTYGDEADPLIGYQTHACREAA